MFIQVIRGKAKDPGALEKRLASWESDVKPGATGFQGGLTGLTQDGEWFTMVRFDTEANARANSDRPEQGAWWEKTAALYDGEPSFIEGDDAETFRNAPNSAAGFVQVMVGRTNDRAASAAFEEEMTEKLSAMHPAFMGSVRLWQGAEYIEAIYFTTEAEARVGEAAMGASEEFAEIMATMQSLGEVKEFLDLSAPIHIEA